MARWVGPDRSAFGSRNLTVRSMEIGDFDDLGAASAVRTDGIRFEERGDAAIWVKPPNEAITGGFSRLEPPSSPSSEDLPSRLHTTSVPLATISDWMEPTQRGRAAGGDLYPRRVRARANEACKGAILL